MANTRFGRAALDDELFSYKNDLQAYSDTESDSPALDLCDLITDEALADFGADEDAASPSMSVSSFDPCSPYIASMSLDGYTLDTTQRLAPLLDMAGMHNWSTNFVQREPRSGPVRSSHSQHFCEDSKSSMLSPTMYSPLQAGLSIDPFAPPLHELKIASSPSAFANGPPASSRQVSLVPYEHERLFDEEGRELINFEKELRKDCGLSADQAISLWSMPDWNCKPPISLPLITKVALYENERLTLQGIFEKMRTRFSHYRNREASGDLAWQNTIRHNLSLHRCFERSPKRAGERGRGSYWVLYKFPFENPYSRERKRRASGSLSGRSKADVSDAWDSDAYVPPQRRKRQTRVSVAAAAASGKTARTRRGGRGRRV